jgi:2-polyprenyl-3-methyl-5-hydroxy-6-metoxy-1,4-benzoquinol methylase
MRKLRQDDPDLVRTEYADESRLAARQSIWAKRPDPQPLDVVFDEIVRLASPRVLEVGCGRGQLAKRLQAAGFDVVATDQSERMVELTSALGVDARVADVQALPFAAAEFDVATANFMLYHVADTHRALAELARVAPRLVAATNGLKQLQEMWNLTGRDLGDRELLFMVETADELLRAHFSEVRTIDLACTIDLSAAEMRHYVANSVAHRHLADRIPDFDGTRPVTASTAVFVASNAA